MATQVPFDQRISVSVDEAASASSLSRRTIYGLIADGSLESRRVRGRRVVMVKSLRRLIEGDRAGPTGERAA